MSAIHCFFCGGKECKYENWKLWTPDKYAGVNAIDGLYSSWITDNIIAMQRPSTRLMKEYDLIKVFLNQNIKAIFNLQIPGEHASCADGLDPSSAFSYVPESFMDNGISFYNFGWTDMEVPDMETVLGLVNVMAFSHQKGEKFAVHCHAGLGRTGLAIACYLVYAQNFTATNAILLIRGKRPLSVQTKKQALFVARFESYLKSLKIFYPGMISKTQTIQSPAERLHFDVFIRNQRWWISLDELKYLRTVPKIVHELIQRIVTICGDSDSDAEWYNVLDEFVNFEGIATLSSEMIDFQVDINNSEWGVVASTTSTTLLVQMLLHWIVMLSEPLITDEALDQLSDEKIAMDSDHIVNVVPTETFETINVMLSFFRKIPSISSSTLDFALERFAIYITSYRESLKNYKKPAPAANASVKQIYQQGDKMVENLKTKVSESINTGLKNIPVGYLSSLPALPQLPQMSSLKIKFGYGSTPVAQKETVKPIDNTIEKEAAAVPVVQKEKSMIQIPVPKEPPAIDAAIQMLKMMYQSFRVSLDNRAILADSKKLAYPTENWKSPSELVHELHQKSTSNLSVLLKPNVSPNNLAIALSNNIGTVTDAFNNYVTKPIRESMVKNPRSLPDLLDFKSSSAHVRAISTPVYLHDPRPSITTTPRDSLLFDENLKFGL